MYKVKVTIEYNTIEGERISSFISRLDLGINSIEAEPEIIEYKTKTKVTKKYIKALRKEFFSRCKLENIIIKDVKIEASKILF